MIRELLGGSTTLALVPVRVIQFRGSRAALESAGEDVDRAEAVAGGNGEVGADCAELLHAGRATHAAGDVDPSLLIRIAC
jgi:hypothetical protein